MKAKIKSIAQLKNIVTTLKSMGKRIVFTNGCFDILHAGHVQYLEAAKQKGDVLIVAVNSDASVKRLKGKLRPIVPERDRLKVIAALESVDFVVRFNDTTPFKLIELLKPHVLIKGGDWKKGAIVGAQVVRSYGGKVCTIPLLKGRSSSTILLKIVTTAGN